MTTLARPLKIDARPLLDWHRAVANFIDNQFDDDSIAQLIDTLQALVDGSGNAMIVYPYGGQPYWPCHRLLPGQDPRIHIDQYVDGAYLLDPYYRLAVENRTEGVFTISDVAPTGFKQSEFYRVYYRLINLSDEACLVVQAPGDAIILISLSRHDNEPRFSQAEKAVLETLFPLVKTLLLKWWRAQRDNPRSPALKSHLDIALSHFGSSILTQREAEIAQLALRGYSVKAVAQKLGVSPETVKHHRKSIYAKLDIGSQAELFYLFIDSLRSVTSDSPADPLSTYLSRSR